MHGKEKTHLSKNLFICYKSLLRRNGLSLRTKDDEKVTVYQVLSVIGLESLQ